MGFYREQRMWAWLMQLETLTRIRILRKRNALWEYEDKGEGWGIIQIEEKYIDWGQVQGKRGQRREE